MADIFVSYTSSDRAWAFWIAKELVALGHTPHVHEWEIPGGGDIAAWMEERHHRADHVLCVVSNAYLSAPYSSWERRAAQWAAVANRSNFALPVVIENCEVPTLLAHIKRCEIAGMNEEDARSHLKAFLAPVTKPAGQVPFPRANRVGRALPTEDASFAFPGSVRAVSNVPVALPRHFLGRDEDLAAIEIALKRFDGRVAITALHGLRGVGKTTLAAAYAERRRGQYRATWWIRAQTESTMRNDLVGLGVRLKWVAADEMEQPAFPVVMDRLRQEGEGLLLIYDNAVEPATLKPYLPLGGHAQVLVTSNAPTWRGIAQPVEIRLWPNQIGADYLIARTGREAERQAAEELSELLGGLPLAHEQAAAYCERLEISFADYAQRFSATPAKFLDDTRHAPSEYHDGRTVAKTFALAIDEAAKLHPAAEPLIVHAALLAPEPIPLFLFSEASEKFDDSLSTHLTDGGLDEAVAALRAFALIDRETIIDERTTSITTDCIRLHRLVRQIAAKRRVGEALVKTRRTLVQALVAVYPSKVFSDPNTWPRARRLDAVTLELVCDVLAGVEEQIATLLNLLAAYRSKVLSAYPQARQMIERALAISEEMLGHDHFVTSTSLHNLASLSHAQGDFAEARALYERALRIREQILGPDHYKTSETLNNLALVLQQEDEFGRARPLFERALAIKEKVLGPEHPDTAIGLNNLAGLLRVQGDFAGAWPLAARALAIREKVLGPEHLNTAMSLTMVGRLLQEQGKFFEALPMFERALAIDEKVVGPEHPHVGIRLNTLAILLQKMGKIKESETVIQRAIAIGSEALGVGHPLTQRFKSTYACLLLDMGRAVEAYALGEAALAVHEAVWGPRHRVSRASASITADALDALDRSDEAATIRAKFSLSSKPYRAAEEIQEESQQEAQMDAQA